MSAAAPRFTQPDDAGRLREALGRTGYDAGGVAERLGTTGVSGVRQADVAAWTRLTREGTPLDTLIRLFLLELAVPNADAERALAPLSLDAAAATGLITRNAEEVGPRVALLPFDGAVLATDRARDSATRRRADFVMGIGKGSRILANSLLPAAGRRCLDVGAGCGVLGLLWAREGGSVVSTDRNPRALGFTRFNAELAEVPLDAREGDLFEPVRGQRFDRVVCHPPFVIAPGVRFQFRDSGIRGDAFCRKIVREAPEHLNEGGSCQIIFNCTQLRGRSWQSDLAGWLEGTGCNALVWAAETQDASSYATTWIRDTESLSDARAAQRYDEWMDFFEREGIEAVTYGVIHMQKSERGPNWVEVDDAPVEVVGPCRDQILLTFATGDWLSGCSDEDLLESRPRLAPGAGLQQRARAGDAGLSIDEVRLVRAGGLDGTTRLDPAGHWIVSHCDGRPLREVVEEMNRHFGGELEALVRSALPAVRMLARRGYLALLPD